MFVLIMSLQLAFGHGGRTDSKGGHKGPGGYHYHNSGHSKPPNSSNASSSATNYDADDYLRSYCRHASTDEHIEYCRTSIQKKIQEYNKQIQYLDSQKDMSQMRLNRLHLLKNTYNP